jgi:hypothetical protein
MRRILSLSLRVILSILVLGLMFAQAQESKPVQLPTPQMDGGRPLMQVLKDRKTTREFSA